MFGISALAPSLPRFTQALLLLLWSGAACAQEFSVNTTADAIDRDVNDGICTNVDDKCSLRAAVMQANQLAGEAHVIYLPAGVYMLSIGGKTEHDARSGDLDIRGNITITASEKDPTRTIVDGGGIDRVFEVVGNSQAIFRFITIRNGKALNSIFGFYVGGGGIAVTGSGRSGKGPTSSILVEHCIIRDNQAESGGGIDIALSEGIIRDTAIINNTAQNSGGGVSVSLAANVSIANSTISGNKTNHSGGGVLTGNLGITLNNVTITSNIADADNNGEGTGGGIASIYNIQNSASNTLIAGNTNLGGGAPDCSVIGFISLGHNLIGDETGCVIKAAEGDQIGTAANPINPQLAPLANNGGSTLTHALLPNSPAIDAGNPLPAGRGGADCEATEQRGESRASHGPCDIGAFETTGGGDAWITAMVTPNTTPSRERVQYQLTVGNNGSQRIRQLSLTLTLPRGSQRTTVTGEGWVCTVADSIYTCLREALNAGSESVLAVQLTPPRDTKELTLEAHIETVSQDLVSANNQVTLITAINRPPRVLTSGLVRYDIQGKPVTVAPDLTIKDEDDTRLKSASVRFTQGYRNHEDSLTAPSTATLIAHWQADQATLTLIGNDTLSAYEQLLRQVRYDNTATDPARPMRQLEISVSDAYADSNPAPVEIEITGDTLASATNHSGDTNNPFVSDTGTVRADTHKRLAPSNPPTPLEDSELAGKRERTKEASTLSRLPAFFGLNEKTANSVWPSVESVHHGDEWLDMNNINTAGHEVIPKILTLGAGITVVAGVVNVFLRSMGFLGMFFSFPLWSRIDPIPVMLLANEEIKRRKEQAEKEEALENKGGHLGQVLDE